MLKLSESDNIGRASDWCLHLDRTDRCKRNKDSTLAVHCTYLSTIVGHSFHYGHRTQNLPSSQAAYVFLLSLSLQM